MADGYGKQGIRTLDDGDASVGILNTSNIRVNVALEGGNLLSIKNNTDKLDVNLSTIAQQATLATLLTQADFDSKAALLATEATLAGRLSQSDFDTKTALLLQAADFDARIGEVQASPTANTVLARLKDINATLTTELDVALSTRASETTLNSIKTEQLSQSTTLSSILAALGGGTTSLAQWDSASLAGGASANHDYTNSSGNVIRLQSVVCASTTSAAYKVFIDPTGAGFEANPRWVGFTSESSPAFNLDLSNYHLANGGKVRVTKKNTASGATAYEVYDTVNAEF